MGWKIIDITKGETVLTSQFWTPQLVIIMVDGHGHGRSWSKSLSWLWSWFLQLEKHTNPILPQEKCLNCNNSGTWIEQYQQQKIILENECWPLYQITQKLYPSCANLSKKGLILKICIFSQTYFPNLQIFLQGYIRHICDVLQLCHWVIDIKTESLSQITRVGILIL